MRYRLWLEIPAVVVLLALAVRERPETIPHKENQKTLGFQLRPSIRNAQVKKTPSPSVVKDANPRGLFLAGTDVDGTLKENESKDLVVDQEVRHLFDYFLSLSGEETIDEVREDIENEVDRQLGTKAAAEAKQLLHRYLNYKKSLQRLELHLNDTEMGLEELKDRLEILKKARQESFTPAEIEGLFGVDQEYALASLSRMEVTQNPFMSDEEKQEKLQALDDSMEPSQREARKMTMLPLELQQKEAQMREMGANEEEIEEAREKTLGPAAASRWKKVEQERKQWRQRVSAYLAERERLQDPAALQSLRDRFFSAQEQRRLEAP